MTLKSPHYIPKQNHCSLLLKKKILTLDGYPIFTIRKKKLKEVLNNNFFFISPTTKNLLTEAKAKVEPNIFVRKAIFTPIILKKNNLCFFSVWENKKIIEFKIGINGARYGKQIKYIPRKHIFEFDKANKRVRLVGKRYFQGWIKILKI